MKVNYHTHTRWCDGSNTVEEMIISAIAKGFDVIGFSSHSTYPDDTACTVTSENLPKYFSEVRGLAQKYSGRIKVLCGLEADYIPGITDPDRLRYENFKPDYIIGSVHYVIAPDGARVSVDHTPEIMQKGILQHFNGDVKKYICSYFSQQREMVRKYDFDIIGHPDLCRKFNVKYPYFDEQSDWYLDELAETAEVFAKSGKIVELNTGAISRGWLDDVYPSADFRTLLRDKGVRFVLNSDSHASNTLDCAFERFATSEDYIFPFLNKFQSNGDMIS